MNNTKDINQILLNDNGEFLQFYNSETKEPINKEPIKCLGFIVSLMMHDDMSSYFRNRNSVYTIGTFVTAKNKEEVFNNIMINSLIDHVCETKQPLFIKHQLCLFLQSFFTKENHVPEKHENFMNPLAENKNINVNVSSSLEALKEEPIVESPYTEESK